MKKITFVIALAIFAASACTKEVIEQTTPEGKGIFRLSLTTADSKTTISPADTSGNRSVLWKSGDQIALNGVTSLGLDPSYDGKDRAVFEFPGIIDPPFNVLYPASMYADAGHITLPATQEAMPGDDDFASGAVPMAGYATSASGDITVKQLCSAAKIRWKQATEDPDPDKILYVEFKGNDGEQVSGDFSINYSTAKLTAATTVRPADKVVRALSGKSQGATACVTNIVVPARTYAKGFTIRIVDESGHFMDKTISASKTFTAGTVHGFAELEFQPTGTMLVIDTKEKLLDWINGTEYKAKGDNVILGADIDFAGETWTGFDFAGTFDGLGHSITNVQIEKTNTLNAYLFNTLSGTIRNLTIGSDSDESYLKVTGTGSRLGIIGTASAAAVIENVVSYADMTYSGTSTSACNMGGIVVACNISTGSISNCEYRGAMSVTTALKGAANIAGVIASVGAAGTVSGCRNYGTINVGADYNASLNYGGIIGYCSVAATIDGCENHGSVKTSGSVSSDNSGQTSMGGVLGYSNSVACTISNCVNDGTVQRGNTNQKHHTYIGGVIGYVKTASLIKNCSSTTAAKVINGGSSSGKYVFMGGIAGNVSAAAQFQNCVNEGSVSGTTSATYIYYGGIMGQGASAIIGGFGKGCENRGKISNSGTSSNASVNSTPNIAIGGIAGKCNADKVCYCVNNGEIVNTGGINNGLANAGNIVIAAGIVAMTNGAAEVSNCINNATVSNTTAKRTARYNTAGIVGYNYSKALVNFSFNENHGDVKVLGTQSCYENNAGGLIGYSNAVATNVSNCVNTGNIANSAGHVAADSLKDGSKPIAMCFGGIVGKHTGATTIQDCTNSGDVTSTGKTYYAAVQMGGIVSALYAASAIKGCSNSGLVREAFTPVKVLTSYFGGIVGLLSTAATTISDCHNTGEISRHSGSTTNRCKFYLGGIVGCNAIASTSISQCTNSGLVRDWAAAGNGYCGGILGITDKPIAISDCKNSGAIETLSNVTTSYIGGIAGTFSGESAAGCTITDCENTGNVKFGAVVSNLRGGGILGDAFGTHTLTRCVNKGSVQNVSASTSNLRLGGVLGSNTSAYTNLISCTNEGPVTNTSSAKVTDGYYGGLAGYRTGAGTVSDCTNTGDVTVSGTFTTLRVGGLIGYDSTAPTISGGKISCTVTSPATNHLGMIIGYATTPTIKTTGVAGTINGTALDADNWKTKICGSSITMTNVNVSGDENSCYLINASSGNSENYGDLPEITVE